MEDNISKKLAFIEGIITNMKLMGPLTNEKGLREELFKLNLNQLQRRYNSGLENLKAYLKKNE